MKTGLVLEGGAMRGLFSAGIMDVLMEEGITFDGLIGVSAGAASGVTTSRDKQDGPFATTPLSLATSAIVAGGRSS